MNTSGNLYETATRRLAGEPERGTAPWARPWTAGAGSGRYKTVSPPACRRASVLLLWAAEYLRALAEPETNAGEA
jgi:antirestriction protein ArdC